MYSTSPALRTFTDCLPTTSSGGLQHEFFPTLPPVQDRPRPEMVRVDHVPDLPELSQLSRSDGSSQADPERVGSLARRLGVHDAQEVDPYLSAFQHSWSKPQNCF